MGHVWSRTLIRFQRKKNKHGLKKGSKVNIPIQDSQIDSDNLDNDQKTRNAKAERAEKRERERLERAKQGLDVVAEIAACLEWSERP